MPLQLCNGQLTDLLKIQSSVPGIMDQIYHSGIHSKYGIFSNLAVGNRSCHGMGTYPSIQDYQANHRSFILYYKSFPGHCTNKNVHEQVLNLMMEN